MIKLTDLSTTTLNTYENAIFKRVGVMLLIDRLYVADFEKEEIVEFISSHFKGLKKFTIDRLKVLDSIHV